MKARIIAHIDMDAFFAAVEQRDNPALKGKPVIVGADPKGGKGRGVVSTCSYEARAFGIHSAMPISIAYQKCPHGVFLSGNMHKYSEVSDQIFDILYDFTPDMEPVSVDEAFLDITGSYHFYQTPLKTCQAIKDRIKMELGLTASIGVAPVKMVAKIASDLCKPDGLLEVLPDQVLDFLCPLPIQKLWGVGPQTQKALNGLGIKTIGELAKYPVKALSSQLGINGQHLYDLANGIDEREVFVDEEVKSVSHEHTFDADTANLKEIYSVLSFLSEKVSRRLRKHDLKGKTLTLKVRLSDFKTVTRAHTFPERINFFEDIYREAKGLFDDFFKPTMNIRLLGVRMAHFVDPYVQDSLFEDSVATKREKVHKAVDQIKDKFGEKAIRRGRSY
ncbi:MAG TPA: DNA polymerase IV [Candidatus Omnitrophota bacterium]|nr:DNA polymerase IV [Candidatus Omnitrophota bacterium]